MVKHHGGRGGTGARPLQAQGLILLLIIITASVQVVVANLEEMAADAAAGKHIVENLDKIKVPGNVIPERWKSFWRGAKTGRKTFKYMKKACHYISDTTPVMSIDTLKQRGMPVMSIDITAGAAAQALSCPSAERAEVPTVGPMAFMPQHSATPTLILRSATFLGCAAPPAGSTSSAVLGLAWGGDLVPQHFTAFSYKVSQFPHPGGEDDCIDVAWSLQALPGRQRTPLILVPQLQYHMIRTYNVRITNILVGDVDIIQQAPLGVGKHAADGSFLASLSTTNPFTYLPRGVYERLKVELVRRLSLVATPLPPPQANRDLLCYPKQSITSAAVPAVDIVFRGGAVMRLSWGNLFLSDCLSILPTTPVIGEALVLGSVLQNGRTMTIQVATDGAMLGTLTF